MRIQLTGVLLFLFIPLVLYLFVVHPEPLGASLILGVVLMLGHRFLARPYMAKARGAKCLWCNRALGEGEGAALELATAGGAVEARCCPRHGEPAARFFAFLHAARWPLRLGIFVPLLLLLFTLAAAAWGRPMPLAPVTDLFRLVIGLTVSLAAWAWPLATPRRPARVPFPAHNFFLLGIRALLWIFRLVGAWWIVVGIAGLI